MIRSGAGCHRGALAAVVLGLAAALAGVLNALSTRLSDDVITGLNAQVSPGGRDPEEVATAWLLAQGLVARRG